MKIASKHIRFQSAMWWPTRRRLNFVSSSNTLQLLETALVVEGYLQRFFFPVLDRFFQQPLSEWTTVTIPYSRVLDCKYDPKTIVRSVLGGLFFLPAVLALALFALAGNVGIEALFFSGMLALLGAVLTGYVCFYRLVPRTYLLFRQADGTRAIIVFRIPSRKRRLEFEEALRKNRAASFLEVAPTKDAPDHLTPALVPFIALTLLLVGGWFGQIVSLYVIHDLPPFIQQQVLGQLLLNGLVYGLPVLLLAAAIAFRHLAFRVVAAVGLLIRGLVPVLFWLGQKGPQLPGQEGIGSLTVSLVFHLVLAAVVVLAVPFKKEGDR